LRDFVFAPDFAAAFFDFVEDFVAFDELFAGVDFAAVCAGAGFAGSVFATGIGFFGL
jgi:hypothetical protein